MPSYEEILATAVLPETTVALCLRGDLATAVTDAHKALEAAKNQPVQSLSDTAVRDAQAAYDAAVAAATEYTVTYRLRGVDSIRWSELVTDNPPRDDRPGDKALGYNIDTFFDQLLRACIVDPVLTDDTWERTQRALSEGQWDRLCNAALVVSQKKVDVPFSLAASGTPPS